MLKNILSVILISLTLAIISGCSSARFFQLQEQEVALTRTPGYILLPQIADKSTADVHNHCLNLDKHSDIGVTLLLRCSQELLSRSDLSPALRAYAVTQYNQSLLSLVKARTALNSRLLDITFTGPDTFLLASEMQVKDKSLRPQTFGEIGLAAVVKRENQLDASDQFYPLEGVYRPHVIFLDRVELDGLMLRAHLKVEHIDKPMQLSFDENQIALRYSPAAAYLTLIESANIDDFSWLGFINAMKAENRRGVFSIGDYSPDKTPLIMIHGLNSDPLIWRFLTMAIFNDESLNKEFQIWHVYYPTGPPPFYNAMRVRRKLRQLIEHIGNPLLTEKAVLIGHSMGGIIAKTLSSAPGFALWDATFTERPELLLAKESIDNQDYQVEDVFIFEPVFDHNTVFFLDTPHKGSEMASSAIGMIGSSLISLPGTFTNLFKNFIDKVGINKLTSPMLPFLKDYGPNSVQVLRPGHPLLETLYRIPVEGKTYSIIGSDGELNCLSHQQCQNISDGVVSYNSANIETVEDKIIVKSSHNSFKNQSAIDFIKHQLKHH